MTNLKSTATEYDHTTGTFSYLDAGGEQTIIEQSITAKRKIDNIWLDVVNLTQDGTWILYHKTDGSNYQEFDRGAFDVATDSDNLLILCFIAYSDWKITWTEGGDEGAARDIYYGVVWKYLE